MCNCFPKNEFVLELLYAIHSLRLLVTVHEATERRLELLSTRSMCHTTKTWAVPIDLAGFGVESALRVGLFLQGLRGCRHLPAGSFCFNRLRGGQTLSFLCSNGVYGWKRFNGSGVLRSKMSVLTSASKYQHGTTQTEYSLTHMRALQQRSDLCCNNIQLLQLGLIESQSFSR